MADAQRYTSLNSSISNGGGSVSVNSSGDITETIASGRAYTLTDGSTDFLAVDTSGNVDITPGGGASVTVTGLNLGYNTFATDPSGESCSAAGAVYVDTDSGQLAGCTAESTAPVFTRRVSWPISPANWAADGTNCTDPAQVTINSGPAMITILCAGTSGTVDFTIRMPDSWDGNAITMAYDVIQTATDTGSFETDIKAMCRGDGDTINNTWGTAVAMDVAAVGGDSQVDEVTSGDITPNGTCAGGVLLIFRLTVDSGNSTTALATAYLAQFNLEAVLSKSGD